MFSDGKVEPAASETLLGSVAVNGSGVALADFAGHLFSAFLFVVLPLHILQLPRQPLNLILILIDLRLIHVQLRRHSLHLIRLLLQTLLIDRQLLSHLRARLPRQQTLQLNIEFLFFLNHYVFFYYLLSFLNQTLLQCLYLL